MGTRRGTVAASTLSSPVNKRGRRDTEQEAPMERRPARRRGPGLLGLLLLPWTLPLAGTGAAGSGSARSALRIRAPFIRRPGG